MADVRAAYSKLAEVLAQCFPNECAHLKKLPKTQAIVDDWTVLLDNPAYKERDLELFHKPPLSNLGLSRLLKAGKLSIKSQTNIWSYADRVLEALQPVEIPDLDVGGIGGMDAMPDFSKLAKLFDNSDVKHEMADEIMDKLPLSIKEKFEQIPKETREEVKKNPMAAIAQLSALFTKAEMQQVFTIVVACVMGKVSNGDGGEMLKLMSGLAL